MSNFFDKLKQGAAEAGKKAQTTIEVNRLKFQISSKEKEITGIYSRMGECVYHAMQNESLEEISDQLLLFSEQVNQKKAEIQEIEDRIRTVQNEKLCPACSKPAALDTKFCSSCGHHFVDHNPNMENGEIKVMVVCPVCQVASEKGSSFCAECGHKFEGQQ
ncbi:zinc ribbon domain-containing protein [Paenibacillus alvei]|uniref:DZANK-type domain-containing protein n=1 Tax=Paenibacillus alvei TaxID=44250 RepID=A0AAP6ZYH7_PAEAL|nr:zinc ribbon domain-containing protein [Paenibacillus alvei]MBG9736252.1 hypothetical protein [Paenibacillus alvei]MBG9745951.1 hypothetical protein [Paenibacillus alvei]MCY9582644.1 zinc ribbon domain-containing protein [Paenibacillus alvei]MCY9588010.1 zinc ribbon domain-containing protein [Paenibacillus alvei]NOJ72364.1 hypothetical protein [Paenibacillus alvei]